MVSVFFQSVHWRLIRWYLVHMMGKFEFGISQSVKASFLCMIIIRQSREYLSQKMDRDFFLLQPINPLIYMILRRCSMLRITTNTSMEILGWTKRKKLFNHSQNIWVNLLLEMWIILPKRTSLQLQVKLSRYGLMNELSLSISLNGIWIRY